MPELECIVPRRITDRHVIRGFTTRLGGVSPAPFDSLNVGSRTGDDRANIIENRRIIYRCTGVDERNVALMSQVHGSSVRVARSGGVFEETDGLVTAETGIMLCIIVADCIPLLLYDPLTAVIGAIHCGWRSIVDGIAEKALDVMGDRFSTCPDTVIAAMGPSAGPCCYEVGDDVARLLHDGSVRHDNGRLFADLRAELCRRLVQAGVLPENIERFDDCTICNESRYFSHRRDGNNAGRMMGFIMLK